jgi:hypothetical protein
LAFHSSTLSIREIVDQLLVMGKTLTISTFHSVITQKKEEDLRHPESRIKLATHQRPSVITKKFLKKLDVEIGKPYPLTIGQFSRKYGVAKVTIHTANIQDIRATLKSRVRTHTLSAKHDL